MLSLLTISLFLARWTWKFAHHDDRRTHRHNGMRQDSGNSAPQRCQTRKSISSGCGVLKFSKVCLGLDERIYQPNITIIVEILFLPQSSCASALKFMLEMALIISYVLV